LGAPQDFNDRLLLELKSTMSKAELTLIRSRVDGGLRNKAKRRELETSLTVALERDQDGRIVLSPDEQAPCDQAGVLPLEPDRLGGQVVTELVSESQRLPRRRVGERRIRWVRASYPAVHRPPHQGGSSYRP
jgi:hypothetical protein